MRVVRLGLMLLAAGTLTARAHAEPSPFGWKSSTCAGGAPVLEARLAELVERHDRERITGSVEVTRGAGHYDVALTLELDGRPLGTRRFQAPDCARAAETAAVAASLAVFDGESAPPAAIQSGIGPDIWTQRPDPQPDFSRPQPAPLPPDPAWLEPRVGLLGTLDFGALPSPAWGGALQLEAALGRRWSLATWGGVTGEQEHAVSEEQAVRLSLLHGGGRACVAAWFQGPLRLDGCAGARLIRARGQGEGFDVNRAATLTWAAPLGALVLSLRGPRFLEWRGELEGSVPTARRRFLVDGDEVSRPRAFGAALRVGAVVRF